MISKGKELVLRGIIHDALDKATDQIVDENLVVMEWPDNLVSMMADAAAAVLLAAEETYEAFHVRE